MLYSRLSSTLQTQYNAAYWILYSWQLASCVVSRMVASMTDLMHGRYSSAASPPWSPPTCKSPDWIQKCSPRQSLQPACAHCNALRWLKQCLHPPSHTACSGQQSGCFAPADQLLAVPQPPSLQAKHCMPEGLHDSCCVFQPYIAG